MAAKTTTKTTSKATAPRTPARRKAIGRGAKRIAKRTVGVGKAAQAAGAHSKVDSYMYDPDKLTIVETPGHVLYQPRRAFTPPVEWLVLSIMESGVSEEITVRRGAVVDGVQQLEVVDGRQRVKAAREAKRRLAAQGKPPLLVKAKIVRESDASLSIRMQLANSRVEMTPMDLAETAEHSLKMGRSQGEIINASFKGSKADFARHMTLLECGPEVQAAVQAGQLNLKAVETLVKLPRDAQAAEVARLIEADLSGARAIKAAVEAIHPGIVESKPSDGAPNEANAADLGEGAAAATGSTPEGDDDGDEDEDDGPELRVRGTVVLAQRLADLQALPLPDDIVHRSVLQARIAEMKWALGDDVALDEAREEERGSWWTEERKRLAEVNARAEKKRKREAAKAAKEAEKKAKEVAKATKEAAKAAKEAEKKAREVAKATREAAKAGGGKTPTQAELVV